MARGRGGVHAKKDTPVVGLLAQLYEGTVSAKKLYEGAPTAKQLYEGMKWPISKVLEQTEKDGPPKSGSSQRSVGRIVYPTGAVLRQGHRLDSPEIANLPRNEVVTILEERGRRLLVDSRNGLHGWLSSKTEAGEPIVSISSSPSSSVFKDENWEKPARFQKGSQPSKPAPLFGSTSNMKAERSSAEQRERAFEQALSRERAFEQAFEKKWQKNKATRSSSAEKDRDHEFRPRKGKRNAQPLRPDRWRPGTDFGTSKYDASSDPAEASTSTGASSSGSSGAGVFDRSDKPPDGDALPRLQKPGSHGSPDVQPVPMDLLDLHSDVCDAEEGRILQLPDPTTLLSSSHLASGLSEVFPPSHGDFNTAGKRPPRSGSFDRVFNTAPPVLGGPSSPNDLISLHRTIPPAPPLRCEMPSRPDKVPARDFAPPARITRQPNEEQGHHEFRYLETLDDIGPEDGAPDTMCDDLVERGGDPEHAVWAADYGDLVEEADAMEGFEGFTDADFGEEQVDSPRRRPLPPDMVPLPTALFAQTRAVEGPDAGSLEALAAKAAADFLAPSAVASSSSLMPASSTTSSPAKASGPAQQEPRADQEFAELAAAAMVDLGGKAATAKSQTNLMDPFSPDLIGPSDAPVSLLD